MTAPPDDSSRTKQRRYFRKELETNVRFTIDGDERDCLCHTISAGGMYVQTVLPPAVGAALTVHFKMPSGIAIKAEAIVRHSVKFDVGEVPAGFGLEFTKIDEPMRLAIIEFVEGEGEG